MNISCKMAARRGWGRTELDVGAQGERREAHNCFVFAALVTDELRPSTFEGAESSLILTPIM